MNKPKGKGQRHQTSPKAKLNNRQRLFVEVYLTCWNASEAARQAGYKSKPNVHGARLLANASIKGLIAERLREAAMPANEVLARLSAHARGSLQPFLQTTGENVWVDLTTEEARANLHLVKEIKTERRRYGKDDNPIEEFKTEIKIHDSQAALVQLGRHHGLFVDKIETELPILVKVDR